MSRLNATISVYEEVWYMTQLFDWRVASLEHCPIYSKELVTVPKRHDGSTDGAVLVSVFLHLRYCWNYRRIKFHVHSWNVAILCPNITKFICSQNVVVADRNN